MAHYIDTSNAVSGLFADGNASTNTPGTYVDAAWLNDIQGNVNEVITGAGITLSKGQFGQLFAAIQQLIAAYATGYLPLVGGTVTGNLTVDGLLQMAGSAILGSANYLNIGGNTVQIVNAADSGLNTLNVAPGTMASHTVNFGQFVNSFASPSYATLPGGLIIQWFTVAVPNDTVIRSYYLPLTFAHVGLSVVCSYGAQVPPNSGAIGGDFSNAAQVRLCNTASGGTGGGSNNISIIAVGY